MRVQLAPWEIEIVKHVGARRLSEAEARGHYSSFPYRKNEGLYFHTMGAAAECAVAKGTGKYWNMGVNTRRAVADVGVDIEVRWSKRGILKVREVDANNARVVLVTGGEGGAFDLQGWEHAHVVKQVGNFYSPRPGPPAYFLAPRNLRPMEDLE